MGVRPPGCYVIVDDEDDPGAFSFAPRMAASKIPAAQTKVIAAATQHYASILDYISGKPEQNEWLDNLKKIVSLGVAQAEADAEGALSQIKQRDRLLEQRLTRFLEPDRNRLIYVASSVLAMAATTGVCLRYLTPSSIEISPNYAFAVAAAMPALLVQYLVAIKRVTPKSYMELKADLSSPAVDTLACAIMCMIVVLLLDSGAIAINLKGLETEQVESNLRTAVLVGIICGLTSRRLGPVLLGFGAKLLPHRE